MLGRIVSRRRVPFDVSGLVRRSTSGRCFICAYQKGVPGFEHVAIAESDTAVAFLNKYPTLFGAAIIAPKAHRVQVTGDFSEAEYLELQRFIFSVAEGMRRVLSPERVYILSLGSQAANSHVHWQVVPLPEGVPLEQQQYHALMHEHGVVEVSTEEQLAYASALRQEITNAA